jgi:hypothetical protein
VLDPGAALPLTFKETRFPPRPGSRFCQWQEVVSANGRKDGAQ